MATGSADYKIIFVHGYTASATDNWYPAISKELRELGVDFEIPNLPGGDYPHAEQWLEKLHSVVSQSKKPVVLVGHSLGTRTILLYLERYQIPVKAVFLIAAFSNRLENARKYDGDGYPDFFEHVVSIEKVKPLIEKTVVVHSRDDELDYEQAVEIAHQLEAKMIPFDDRGHFSDPENAPYILKILREELGF